MFSIMLGKILDDLFDEVNKIIFTYRILINKIFISLTQFLILE